jgi:hypothetical protein
LLALFRVPSAGFADTVHHLMQFVGTGFGVSVTEVAYNVCRDNELTVAKRGVLLSVDAGGNLICHPVGIS